MSCKPGNIPQFVDEMLLPPAAEEASAEVAQSSGSPRPKSEVARTASLTSPPPPCDARPKSDFTQRSSGERRSEEAVQKPDKSVVKEPGEQDTPDTDCSHYAIADLQYKLIIVRDSLLTLSAWFMCDNFFLHMCLTLP